MTAEAADRYPREPMLRALAHLVHGLRPDWPETSVLTLLRSSSRPLEDLILVAVHAARDRTAHTPGVIEHRSPCPASAPSTVPSGYSRAVRAAALQQRADPDSVVAYADRIRADLARRTR